MNEEALKLFKRLIAEDKLEDLIIILKLIKIKDNTVIQLSSGFNSLKTKIINGTISEDNAKTERNKVIESLLFIIEGLKNGNDLSSTQNDDHDKEIYKKYLEKFIELSDSKNWHNWTEGLFLWVPSYSEKNLIHLKELIQYITTRNYPENFQELKIALINFVGVANDFINCFNKYSEKQAPLDLFEYSILKTLRFDRIDIPDTSSNEKHKLSQKYYFHQKFIYDLVLEMTRALNYIYEIVRIKIMPQFGIDVGIITVDIGGIKDVKTHGLNFLYKESEKIELYPNIERFMEIRNLRNYHFGKGIDKSYLSEIEDDLPF